MSMKPFSAALLVLSLAGGARAAGGPKPNALTPGEAAQGWLLLWDGETAFGWNAEGAVEMTDGLLKLGGPEAAALTTTAAFGRGEVRVSSRQRGRNQAELLWRGERQTLGGGGGW